MIGDTSKHTTREKRRIGSVINRPIEVLPYEKGDNKDLTLTFKARNFNDRELTVKPDEYIDNKPLGYKFKEIDYQEIINIDLSKTPFIKILLKGDLNIDNIINKLNYSEYVIIFVQNNIGNYNVTMNDENINFYLNNNASLGDINKNPNGVTILKYNSINDVFYGELNSLNEEDYQERIYKPFIFTIDTTKGSGSSFNLPLRTGYNYDMLVDWGDNTTSEVKSFDSSGATHTYTTGGIYQIKISGLCESWHFNNGGDKLKITSIDQWGYTGFIHLGDAFWGCTNLVTANDSDGNWCRNVKYMGGLFDSCSSLISVNSVNWNTINLLQTFWMFNGCSSLSTLDVSNWDVSNVNNMSSMFRGCSSLATLDVSNWDVSNVTNLGVMFYNCSNLTSLNVSNWNVSNVTNMSNMFQNCSNLTTLDVSNWDVSNVTNMSAMFWGLYSLEDLYFNNWDVSNVTNMSYMFGGDNNMNLQNIIGIENWNTSNVTTMQVMFQKCANLITLNLNNWDVSNVTNMSNMFAFCSSLESIVIDNWDVSNVTNMRAMFGECTSLKNINVANWNVANVNDLFNMFEFAPLSLESYNNLLIGWSQLPSLKTNRILTVNGSYYTFAASEARQYIIDTYGWTINDLGLV